MAIEKHPVSTSDSSTTGTTVLFVDDESTLIETYESLFDPEFRVLTAETGTEAFQVFDHNVDIVFIDRRMPNINGEELVESLRAEGYDTPMVFLSAVNPRPEPDVDYDGYLTKPVDPDTIRTAVLQYAA